MISIASPLATRAVRMYNSGTYRGRRNVELDRDGYSMCANGFPANREGVVAFLTFVGREYGGAQRRFLPHDWDQESGQLADNVLRDFDRWVDVASSQADLIVAAPTRKAIAVLLDPFRGTKRWPAWASKVLHFAWPRVYPVLDSRARLAVGAKYLSPHDRDYHEFCLLIRSVLLANPVAIQAAREVDGRNSPSDIKLLDKILYQVGVERGPSSSSSANACCHGA